MTPLPCNPTVVILLNKNADGLVEAVASNIDPDLNVKVVTTVVDFNNEACNKPFDSTRPRQPEQVLASK